MFSNTLASSQIPIDAPFNQDCDCQHLSSISTALLFFPTLHCRFLSAACIFFKLRRKCNKDARRHVQLISFQRYAETSDTRTWPVSTLVHAIRCDFHSTLRFKSNVRVIFSDTSLLFVIYILWHLITHSCSFVGTLWRDIIFTHVSVLIATSHLPVFQYCDL